MFFQLLSNLSAGGITGYITNSLAIKMLFKRYPVVGGGVLASNFEEFVENISQLVERDLINHATLQEEFSSETFKTELQKAVEHLLQDTLYARFEDDLLSDIPGVKTSVDAVFEFIGPMEARLIDALLQRTAAHVMIDDLLPVDLQASLSDTLFSYLYESVVALTPELLTQLQASDLTIEKLLTQRMMTLLDQRLDDILMMVFESIDPDAFETLLHGLRAMLRLDELIPRLLEMLLSKSIEERLGEERTAALSNYLMGRFLLLMQTKQGEATLVTLSAAILESLKTIEEPLSELLSEQTTQAIIELVETHLPRLLALMIDWLEANSSDLETFIERLIDESLKSGGPLGKMKYSFKALFLGKVTERFRVIERLTGILDDESSRDEHVRKGLDIVLDAISKRSIGDVVTELTARNWLTPQLLTKLIRLNLPRAAPFIERLMFGELFARPLYSLFHSDWQARLLDLVESMLEPSRISFWLKDPNKNMPVRTLAATTIRKTLKRPLGAFVDERSADSLLDILSEHKQTLQSHFAERVEKRLNGLPLSIFVDEQSMALIRPKLQRLLESQRAVFLRQLETTRLHSLFDIVAAHESSAVRLSDIAIMGVDDNLPLLLEKNVSMTVKNELLGMGPIKLQEQVEEFMGAELGPITWLGAGLGAGVGGVLYGVQQHFGALEGPYLYVLVPMVYGATGIMTNWLALKMLFRPYESKRLFGFKIPFTPGIVGKRKPFFAKNMSRFVDETLLTQDAIYDKIKMLRPHVIDTLKRHITADDYHVAHAFLDHHAEYFSTEVFFFAYEAMTSRIDADEMAAKAILMADETDLSSLRAPEAREPLRAKVRRRIESGIVSRAHQWLDDYATQTLRDALPTQVPKVIDRLSALGVEKALRFIQLQLQESRPILTTITALADPMLQHYSGRQVKALMPSQIQVLLSTRLSEYVVSRLQSERVQDEVIDFIQSILLEETVQTDKSIGEMFNGALTETIEENLRLLFDHGLEGIIEQLQNEKQSINTEIRRAIKRHNNFATNTFFRASGVFGDIRRFINILIDKEMPRFLEERKQQIESVTHEFLEGLKEKELSTFGIKEELLDLHAFTPVIREVLSHPDVTYGLGQISMSMVEDTYAADLDELLDVMDFTTADTLLEPVMEEIEHARVHLLERLDETYTPLLKGLSIFIKDTRQHLFERHTLDDLLSGMTHQDIEAQIHQSFEQLFTSSALQTFEQHLVTSLIDAFEREGIGAIIDKESLEASLAQTITRLLQNTMFRDSIARIIIPVMANTLRSLNGLVDDTFKHYVLDNGLDAAYDTVIANMEGLVGAIDFKEVIEREINAMHPSELEAMLNSFAKVYFNRLILYGAYGAVFGIPVAFSY